MCPRMITYIHTCIHTYIHTYMYTYRRIFLVGGRYWDVPEDDYIFMNDIHVLDTRPTVNNTMKNDWEAFVNSELLSDLRVISSRRIGL